MTSKELLFDFVISTDKGMVPYLIESKVYNFNKPMKIFLDDFLYKDSFYDKGNVFPLNKFVGRESLLLSFKNKRNTLTSKKGNYKLTDTKYNEVIKNMGPVRIESENETIEPKDLEDFNNIIKKAQKTVFGTSFINKMTEAGDLLFINVDSKTVFSKNITSDINIENIEYYSYLHSIKEINAFSFISEWNYQKFKEIIDLLNN